jgi:hypothetical protein
MSAADRLKGISLKIERAKHHIGDCEVLARSPDKSGFYGLKPDKNPKTGDTFYRVWFPSDPPANFALIAGEAVHHLRSCLDHLAWQLVEASGGSPDHRTEFPIYKMPPTSSKEKADFNRKVKGICSAAISVIETVQPYQSGYGDLWKLHELNNIDKHRFLFVAVHAIADATVRRFKPGTTHATTVEASFRSATKRVMLKNGDAVIGITKGTQDPSQVNEKLNITFDIAFREPEVVQGETVLELLSKLSSLVEGIVSLFVLFL